MKVKGSYGKPKIYFTITPCPRSIVWEYIKGAVA